MTIFFTSDLHYGHANIIKYCARPFPNVEEMNAGLIRGWNEVISTNDDVYFLGDLCLAKSNTKPIEELLDRLHGRIHWIKGNHDPSLTKLAQLASKMPQKLVWTGLNMVLDYQGKQYFLTHKPIDSQPAMPTIAGHVHEKWRAMQSGTSLCEFKSNRVIVLSQAALNVGVDVWTFRPVHIQEAIHVLEQGPYDQVQPAVEPDPLS